mgnify:FL=1|jgi:hypothetical protein
MAYNKIQKEKRYRKPDLPNHVNQNPDVASELEERERITDNTLCAMKTILPKVLKDLAKIKDYRTKNIKHSLTLLLAYGILMFALHYSSRRETNREMTDPVLRENLKALFPELETLPHGDTLYRLLNHIEAGKIEETQINLLKKMIKKKKFMNYLIDKKYRIAIDGTQKLARKGECDDEYLIRHVGAEKEVQSYIYVLEAVLVLGNGMVIPFMSEFLTNKDIENETGSAEQKKQDCERKAFRRLAGRIKEAFPRLRIVLIMDSLYAAGPVFSICRDNNWDYMINFKSGSIPTVYREAEALMRLTPENMVETIWGDRKQTYTYINELDYEYQNTDTGKKSRMKLNVVKCHEEWEEENKDDKTEEKETTYVWLSSKKLTQTNVFRRCTLIARYRWQIENNILVEKHQGYGYEHSYARSANVLKGYHYLSKIAHMIMTLVMMSSNANEKVKELGKRGFIRYIKKCMESCILMLKETRSDKEHYLQLMV